MTYLTHELIAVEIPEDADNIIIWNDEVVDNWADEEFIPLCKLPTGNFKILGTISPSMCDFDCEGVVDKVKHYTWGGYGASKIEDVYLDYLHIDESICRTSIESFRSLLQSKTLDTNKRDTNKRYLIIQKQ